MTLGFIGVGTIAAAFIEGLQRRGGHQIVVSPRSAETSQALARRFPETVRRAASNAEVAAASDIVFLAMRPPQLEDALDGIGFRAGQTIISFVAALPLAELQALAPQSRVMRMVPLPAIAQGRGPVIAYPALDEGVALLEGMGDVVLAGSEPEMRALSSVSAFMSSYFELQAQLSAGLQRRGVAEATAGRYVRSILVSLAETAAATPEDRQGRLVEEHQTPGGLNQRVRQHLLDAGWFAEPETAFAAAHGTSRTALK